MTDHHWLEIREQGIEAFAGELPQAETEAAIVDVFSRSPLLVIAELEEIARRKRSGSVRSGWAVLRSSLLSLERQNVTASDAPDREKLVAMGERWLRNAGCHCEHWDEAFDALFGDYGGFDDKGHSLRAWREDTTLVARLRGVWAKRREALAA